jgi:hypothetical protein
MRVAYPVDAARFFLFHPADGVASIADGVEAGLVCGLNLGADGWRAIELVPGDFTEQDRNDIRESPFVFRLDVRHGALFASDHLGPDVDPESRLSVPNGRYRAEWHPVTDAARERRQVNWLLRLVAVEDFDAVGTWIDQPGSGLPSEDLGPDEREPPLVAQLSPAASSLRQRVKSGACADIRIAVDDGEASYGLGESELVVEARGQASVRHPLPPDDREKLMRAVASVAIWWLPSDAPEGAAIRATVELPEGRCSFAEPAGGSRKLALLRDRLRAMANLHTRRRLAQRALEELLHASELPESFELRLDTLPASGPPTKYRLFGDGRLKVETRARLGAPKIASERVLSKEELGAIVAAMRERAIWSASTAAAARPSLTLDVSFPEPDGVGYLLSFADVDTPESPLAAIRDRLAPS